MCWWQCTLLIYFLSHVVPENLRNFIKSCCADDDFVSCKHQCVTRNVIVNYSIRNNSKNGRSRTESDRPDVASRQKAKVCRRLFRFFFWVRTYYDNERGSGRQFAWGVGKHYIGPVDRVQISCQMADRYQNALWADKDVSTNQKVIGACMHKQYNANQKYQKVQASDSSRD